MSLALCKQQNIASGGSVRGSPVASCDCCCLILNLNWPLPFVAYQWHVRRHFSDCSCWCSYSMSNSREGAPCILTIKAVILQSCKRYDLPSSTLQHDCSALSPEHPLSLHKALRRSVRLSFRNERQEISTPFGFSWEANCYSGLPNEPYQSSLSQLWSMQIYASSMQIFQALALSSSMQMSLTLAIIVSWRFEQTLLKWHGLLFMIAANTFLLASDVSKIFYVEVYGLDQEISPSFHQLI